MTRITAISARQVLDSRGRPTIEAVVEAEHGARGRASVPSGASTGSHEAHELRDGGAAWSGLGVGRAVSAVTREIAPELVGEDVHDQESLDATMIELDGTPQKSRLGANAILAVSIAAAKAASAAAGGPLWRRISTLAGEATPALPMPMVNMISGGLHARQGLPFQDFMVIPVGAPTYSEALRCVVEVRDALERELNRAGLSTLKADEGGFGPVLEGADRALELICDAISATGREPGSQVSLALDVAANHVGGAAAELHEQFERLAHRFPVVSIEDPFGEDEWDDWARITRALGSRVQIVGDDLFTTNVRRIGTGIERGAANAVLIKMNQIGSLSETLAAVRAARGAGYRTVISARSGETEDTALADLAVAVDGGQIKIGSVAQSERLAKYNRLLAIEEELGPDARFASWSAIGPNGKA